MSLYNALNGRNCTDPDEIEINTIEDVIYMGRKNDVSCIVDGHMNLFEHQSTYNPNMPLRGMIYIAKLYEKYIERYGLNIFSEHPEKIPTPCYLDLQAEVTQFYSEMFDIDVDNDLYAMMLSGSGIRNASQNGGA